MIFWQQQQLNLLKSIPKSPFWDGFFLTFNHFDSFAFAIFTIIFVWKLLDKKIGIRFFYLMTLSFFLNVICKKIFSLPRPCQLDPSFALMCLTSFGFPSGASQSATIYFGITCLEAKKRSYIFLAFIFSFLLCFSRLYLGVHFFTDVLGGIGIGFVCVLFYKYGFAKLEKISSTLAILFALLMLLINFSIFYSASILILSIVFTQKLIEKNWLLPIYLFSKTLSFFSCFIVAAITVFTPSYLIFLKILELSILGFCLAALSSKPQKV